MGAGIFRFEMSAPDDVGALECLIASLRPVPGARLAVIAKTEGTATLNDFSRALALRALSDCLATAGFGDPACTQVILSTGSEGVITPGGWLLCEGGQGEGMLSGLAFGIARSEPLMPAEMITAAHARIAARVVAEACRDAGVGREEIGLVLMKSPVLLREDAVGLPDAQRKRANSTSLARGIAGIGIAIATGEIDAAAVTDDTVGREAGIFSRRGMVFSGPETRRCEAIVLANAPGYPAAVRCGTIADLLDIDGMARILAPGAADPLAAARGLAQRGFVRAAFLKAGLAPDGRLRGQRTTIFSSDLEPDKHMRAAASGVLGALLGDTRSFISGGAEHQAPPGGGLFAAGVSE
jgi:cyanuric acid amidohydrolase